jgi:hypothetical protein
LGYSLFFYYTIVSTFFTPVSNFSLPLQCELAHKYNKCVITITHATEVAERADLVLKMDDGILKLL